MNIVESEHMRLRLLLQAHEETQVSGENWQIQNANSGIYTGDSREVLWLFIMQQL